MECNKEESLRAKEFAEQKFAAKDIAGAKKYALKALNLFPELEGVNQMILTLDVYLAAETKINGEYDWYSILCVNSSSDDDSIRKQYRKLALQLHPDKNKSVGAEGAFSLVSEAWSVLSDENRKLVYDQKINIKKNSQRKKRNHSAHNNENGFFTFTKTSVPNSNTFWTSCNRCKMQYEYLRVYLNHNLLCPNCHEAFVAVETGFPSNGTSTNFSWSNSQQTQKKSKHKNAHSSVKVDYNNTGFQWGPFSNATDASSISSQAANMVHQTYEKVKKERELVQATAKREGTLKRKNSVSKKSVDTFNHYNAAVNVNLPNNNIVNFEKKARSASEDAAIAAEKEREANKTRIATARINKISRVIAQFDKRSLLMEKAKAEMSKKLEEWKAAEANKLMEKAKAKPKQKVRGNDNDTMPSKDNNSCMKELSNKKISKQDSIVVPDPEFHDFDKDRLEKLFESDQIWATYDSEDGMPRFYAFIQKVISLRPFKCRMSFLNSKTNAEFSPMNWVGCGFAKTSGDFRVSRYAISDTANIFSHRVYGEKGARGIIKIYPRKGETWALYKNWSPGWNELTPDEVIYKYDIVEVIDDYKEEEGIVVAPLVKVAGFRAIFHKHMDPNENRKIPREEMFRFSHQVPSYLLTGDEAHNAPKGCRELDPAAIPSDLLQLFAGISLILAIITDET